VRGNPTKQKLRGKVNQGRKYPEPEKTKRPVTKSSASVAKNQRRLSKQNRSEYGHNPVHITAKLWTIKINLRPQIKSRRTRRVFLIKPLKQDQPC
jgi:hypothetical protein